MTNPDEGEKLVLIRRLQFGEGTFEEAQQWLARLKEIDPYFHSSDFMLQLETIVDARRIEQEHKEQYGAQLSKEQLIELVRKVQNAEGTDAEQDAWLNLVIEAVGNSSVSDLIYWSEEELSAEEIVEKALTEKPSILSPPSSE